MVGGNRTKRSPVWNYFTQKQDGGICELCKMLVQGKGGNTSNLSKHLKLRHNIIINPCTMFANYARSPSEKSDEHVPADIPAKVEAVQTVQTSTENDPPLPQLEQPSPVAKAPLKQVTLHTFNSKNKKMPTAEKEKTGRAVTKYIVKEMQPFSTISSKPFRQMLKALNPNYVPPNKETFSSDYIPAWYEVELHKLKEDLALASWVGITADHWLSLNGDHYLTVTVHFVKDWTLINKVLETKAVYESQTGEVIANEIHECLIKFGIVDKVVGITVDNAANMAACAKSLNIMRLPCFAHSMNVSASKLYNDTTFTRWLARIRSVVLWFKRVHMASVVLKEKLKALDLPNLTVLLDVKTRWNSMYLMVERFAEIYPGLSAASRDPRIKKRVDKEKVERISDSDLKKSEEFVECMRILYTSTLAISTDKVPTVGQVLPTWTKLKKSFTVQDDDSDFVKAIKTVVWSDMKKRYQDPEIVNFLEEATALDPRFKAKIQDSAVWGRLEAKLVGLIEGQRSSKEIKIKTEPELPDSPSTSTESLPEGQPDDQTGSDVKQLAEEGDCVEEVKQNLKRKRSAIEELFDDEEDVTITKIQPPPSAEFQAHVQMEHYRGLTGIKMDGNPLEFYATHQGKFPMVAALALKYLSVSGSSVPSERVFSLAGNTISQKRVRICPEKADMLIFLHKNAD